MFNLQLYSQEYVGAQVVSMERHVNLVSLFLIKSEDLTFSHCLCHMTHY